jgi:adenylate cyclase
MSEPKHSLSLRDMAVTAALWVKGWRLTRPQRRLRQAIAVGLAVAGAVLAVQRMGLFASAQYRAADYLYDEDGDPGDDVVIVAIDEESLQALGDWPLSFDPYVRLFERLQGASAVGLDVLLPDSGPEGNEAATALVEAARQGGNVVVPLAALQLERPTDPGELYVVGQGVRTFPALLEAAAGAGSVNQPPDQDGTLRRVPLLVDVSGGETWEAFALQLLRLRLGLGAGAKAILEGEQVVIGDEDEVLYQVRTDANGAMLVNFVGRPNTFRTYSLVDVIEGRVPANAFEGRIVLVGLMNALTEMDLHQTPVSPQRMSGVEFQANVVHTLLHHRALVQQGEVGAAITVVALALISAIVVSLWGALPGAFFALLLALGYLAFTSVLCNRGCLPRAFFPYVTIFLNYAVVTAVRFTSERGERRQVTDVFGRFVSAEVRDVIVNMALEDPVLIRPGGRQMEISVLFADIRGFTTMSENLAPAKVVEILNQYLDSMEEEVFEQGGTLDKYTGDGMMVLFGAPLEQPDHAERAVRAALGMQRAAAGVSHRRGETEWEVAYGIGITTGPAVVGQIGSQRRLDYTAIGDTVNLAARLEGQAPPGTILISQATYDAVKEVAIVETLAPVKVKGKVLPVPVYKVTGMREDHTDVATLDEAEST